MSACARTSAPQSGHVAGSDPSPSASRTIRVEVISAVAYDDLLLVLIDTASRSVRVSERRDRVRDGGGIPPRADTTW